MSCEGPKAFFRGEQMLLSTSQSKSFMWVTFSFAVVIARWRSHSDRLSKITFVHTLIASHGNGNERPECTEAARVPVNAWPDPQLLPFGKEILYFTKNRTSQYRIIAIFVQVQGAEARLRNLFYSGNLLIFGGFWKELTFLACVRKFETGVFVFLESYSKNTPATSGRGFRLLQFVWLCSLLHSIGIYLRDCSEAATAERKGLGPSVWAWLTDSERCSALCIQTCRCADDV